MLDERVWITNVHNDIPYALSNYLTYDQLSSKYKAFVTSKPSVTEPATYVEANKDPRWIEAMQAEVDALQQNNTWQIVDLPKGKVPIGCKWIFKIKYKDSGEIQRFKASLTTKGYSQQERIDYQETFSPVIKMVTVRTVLAIVAAKK
ncbi:uncharacterized mitochondrial protein AtMg00820-like [Lycium ferocissimum]|uniref:uncharacterized mitochondrial protein AtMg00820-like n=1 Tax=Lycium ferocissimum TaxID=112874 RepID=UPI002815E0F0|nr:uncharacterized mitochondrial protein AtMg00820-like [Lycium ferocissimum]